MQIKIQSLTPMEQAIKWQIHHDYFHHRGTAAWLQQEIPYAVTSNYRAAWQMARLLFESLLLAPPPPQEKIYVLETGAGLGIFALNFMRAFEDLCTLSHAPYANQLCYLLSDYAPKTLQEVARNSYFQARYAQGQVEYLHLDIRHPMAATLLDGQPWTWPTTGLRAVIANYNFCNLSTQVWRCIQGQWTTPHVASFYELTHATGSYHPDILAQTLVYLESLHFDDHAEMDEENQRMLGVLDRAVRQLHDSLLQFSINPASCNQMAQPDYLQQLLYENLTDDFQQWYDLPLTDSLPTELIEPLQQASLALSQALENNLGEFLLPLVLQYQEPIIEQNQDIPFLLRDAADPSLRHWLSELGDQFAVTSLPYSQEALSALRALWPLLHPDGLLLIADKGVAQESAFEGVVDFAPSMHGRSLNYPVNFPLLQATLEQLQGFVLHTTNPSFGLQVLLATANGGLQQQLQDSFGEVFVSANLNEFTYYLVKAAGDYAQEGRLAEAATFYAKVLEYVPLDAAVLYHLGACYLKLGDYPQALRCLTADNDDYYHIYDFTRLAGQALLQMGHAPEALFALQHSQKRWGEDADGWHWIGRCLVQMGNFRQAHDAFKQAATLAPENSLYQQDLEKLHDTIFATWVAAQPSQ